MYSSILIISLIISLTQAGDIVRESRPLDSTFDEIKITGSFDIFLTQSDDKSASTVEIETIPLVQKNVIVEIVDKHILSIHVEGVISFDKTINVYIKFPSTLCRYTVGGSCNTKTEGNGITITGDKKFILDNSGSSDISMQLNVNELEAHLSGSGETHLSGEVRGQATFETKDSHELKALDLSTKQVKVSASGSSSVEVSAKEDGEFDASDSSSIHYRLPAGKKPSKETTSGSAKILPMDKAH